MKSRKRKGRLYLSFFLLFIGLAMCSTYAFLTLEVTKVDVSGPDPDGPVIVPENYQGLLVLDVTVPAVDIGAIGEDVLLHNGVAGSNARDILILLLARKSAGKRIIPLPESVV